MVSSIDKKTDDKNKILNYRLVSVLNIFAKVYEIVLRNELVSALSDYMFTFISAYKEEYNTQHCLIKEWRIKLDDDYIVGSALMDLPFNVDPTRYFNCQTW